jgi:large subunit ribosomal protein L15
MNLASLKFVEGSKKKPKRIGRGTGSGHGGTSTRGHKGYGSRSGSGMKFTSEGGQMPIHRRLPKRGFKNIFREQVQVINLRQIAHWEEKEIDKDLLKAKGLINKVELPVKLLGVGEINRPFKIIVNAVSASAKSKVEAVGGEVILL